MGVSRRLGRPIEDGPLVRSMSSERRLFPGDKAVNDGPILEPHLPFVYMLRCRDGSLYTGSAKRVAARLRQHEQGRASRYTRARLPVTLVWWRRVRTWSKALREEYRLKQLRRADKELLVNQHARMPRSESR